MPQISQVSRGLAVGMLAARMSTRAVAFKHLSGVRIILVKEKYSQTRKQKCCVKIYIKCIIYFMIDNGNMYTVYDLQHVSLAC